MSNVRSKASGRKRRGTIVTTRDGRLQAQVTLADGSRRRMPKGGFPRGTSDAMARERAAFWQGEIDCKAIRRPAKVRRGGAATAATLASWAEPWLAERRARGLTSTCENDAHIRHHIVPAIGEKHVKDWTKDDMRKLSRELDAKVQRGAMSWKTAMNVWATARRMARDACMSKSDELRCREDNPCDGVAPPDTGSARDKQVLHPSEAMEFLSCLDVPLVWRRIVALHVYLGVRTGELSELLWEDVDVEHGTIHIHRARDRRSKGATKCTKGKRGRRFRIEPAVLPLLRAMHEESGGQGRVLSDMPDPRNLAVSFRRYLLHAGVERAELHKTTATSRQMRRIG